MTFTKTLHGNIITESSTFEQIINYSGKSQFYQVNDLVYKTYTPSEGLWITCWSASTLHKENKFVLTPNVEWIGQMEYGKDKRGKDLNREKHKLNQLNVTLRVNKFALNWAKFAKNTRRC